MISGPPISDTSRCDIGSPDITSDIDSDIGGIVLRYRRSYLRYHSTDDNDRSDREMDADDLRDFEDQCPQVPPRSTANVGPYA